MFKLSGWKIWMLASLSWPSVKVKYLNYVQSGLFVGENDRSGYVEVTQNLLHVNDRSSHGVLADQF